MADNGNAGSGQPGDDQTITGDAAALNGAGAPPNDGAGNASQPPDTTLLSRIAGLDAKVTSLSQETAREKAAREAAEQKLRDYEAGKVGADEALRAQVEAKDAELAQVRQEARLARIEGKYPETFGVLGAAAAGLTDDQLAASEARFAGLGESTTPRKPLGNNQQRQQAPVSKPIEDMTQDELRAHLNKFDMRQVFGVND
jgi:hypothetical protein